MITNFPDHTTSAHFGSDRAVYTVLVLVAAGTAGLISILGEVAIVLFIACVCAVLAARLAYTYPVVTICLWILSSQVAVELLPGSSIPVGRGTFLRFSDPVLLGVSGALVLSAFRNPEWTWYVLLRRLWWWTLLFAWMLLLVIRSVGEYGIISALGEFRSYYQHILIVPYLVLFFRDRKRQKHLLWLLLITTVVFLVAGYLKGWAIFGFTFSAHKKWLNASSTMVVLFGGITAMSLIRFDLLKGPKSVYSLLLFACLILLIITGHRSVWLAAVVSVVLMIVLGQVSGGTVTRMAVAGLIGLFVITLIFSDTDLQAFFSERIQAFTAFRQDNTANWRLQRWLQALEQVSGTIWTGGSLGRYFNLSDSSGSNTFVSLHNQYVQLVYQAGIVSLVMYAGFAYQCLRCMWRMITRTPDPVHYVMLSSGLIMLTAANAYYIANGFEYVSWLYVGLGLAVACAPNESGHRLNRAIAPEPSSIPHPG